MFVNKAQICLSTKHRYVCQQSIYIKHRYVTKVPTVKLHIYGHLVEQVDFLPHKDNLNTNHSTYRLPTFCVCTVHHKASNGRLPYLGKMIDWWY